MTSKRKFDEFLAVTTISLVATTVALAPDSPVPKHTSILTGKLYFEELARSENPSAFRNKARMSKEAFHNFLQLLIFEGGLKEGRSLLPGEKLLIFIQVLKGETFEEIADRFQHSSATVSQVVREVSTSIMNIRNALMVQPTANQPDSARILNDPKFFPYFSGCIGAIDGTHIPVTVPTLLNRKFRNRKGVISQNSLWES